MRGEYYLISAGVMVLVSLLAGTEARLLTWVPTSDVLTTGVTDITAGGAERRLTARDCASLLELKDY